MLDANTSHESKRLEALIRTGLLDTASAERFDRLTRLASHALGCEIALVSLIDTDRQWFKSKVGLEVDQTDRCFAFCDHAIRTPDDVMVILDACKDERFKDNPLVVGEPWISFYAGAPLVTADGFAIGTLCVIDSAARESFSDSDSQMLKDIAVSVMTEIELATKEIEVHDLEIINNELKHRMGNMYAHVSGVVSLLGKSDDDRDTLIQRLRENISALAQVQALLSVNDSDDVALCDLIDQVMSSYTMELDEGAFGLKIPPTLRVASRSAFLFTLMINELATNSRKHGALGELKSSLSIGVESTDAVKFFWREKFSPRAVNPGASRIGFGTKILKNIAPHGLAGEATMMVGETSYEYTLVCDPSRLNG